MRKTVKEVNCADFERIVFGWQNLLSVFNIGKHQRVVADYDPEERMVRFSALIPDENGELKERTWGKIKRTECERFILFAGKKCIESFEIGKKQRVIVDYDPEKKKATIECQTVSK